MKTIKNSRKNYGTMLTLILSVFIVLFSFPQLANAHCDSYDGPVIKDALKALKENNVQLILKWVEPRYEEEIIILFKKTKAITGSNQEVNEISEKYFLETLVRLHREGEGERFTGLKPAGSTTKIIQMADNSLNKNDINNLTSRLNAHIEKVIKEKYEKAVELSKTKDESVKQGRAYVEAYVDYTHTLEGIESILKHGHE